MMNVVGRRPTYCAGRPHAHAMVEPNRSLWSALNRSATICAVMPRAWRRSASSKASKSCAFHASRSDERIDFGRESGYERCASAAWMTRSAASSARR